MTDIKTRMILKELIKVVQLPFIIKQLKKTDMTYNLRAISKFKTRGDYPEDFIEFMKTNAKISISYRDNAIATDREIDEMRKLVYKAGSTKVARNAKLPNGSINHYLNGSQSLKFKKCVLLRVTAERILEADASRTNTHPQE